MCSPAKWQFPERALSAPEKRVYWPTLQYEYEPFVHGYAVQKSGVALPFQASVAPASTGSSWPRNRCARDRGVPEPKDAPIVPPV